MANKTPTLNPQQQAALNNIMKVPTNAAPAESYQVPELTPQASPAAASSSAAGPRASVNNITNTGIMDTPKKNNLGVILVIIVGLITLGAYAFFWLRFFGFV